MNNYKNDLVSALGFTIKEIVSKNLSDYKILAAYIYGQNTQSIIQNKDLLSDEIDCLVLVDTDLKQGASPIKKDSILLFDQLSFKNRQIRTIFNGIIPEDFNPKTHLLVDIIGDGLLNIKKKDPSSIVTSKKPKLLIYGQDHYKSLENEVLSFSDKITIYSTLVNYLNREFLVRNDKFAYRIIAKNLIFLASLSSSETIKLNDKSDIVTALKIKFPEGKTFHKNLDFFLQTYQGEIQLHNFKKKYQLFCEMIKMYY